jgi:nucleotide-binding universal stress UspA family protein
MIPTIKNILYATDLSKNSAYAFRYAVNSAQKHDARIHLLHVFERLSPAAEKMIEIQVEQSQFEELKRKWDHQKEIQIQRIQDRLREFARRELGNEAQALNRVASIVVVEGAPEVEILRKMKELDCDILIMGTHSHGIVDHAFLGSVAEKVLRRINKPVFVIPIPSEDTDITFRDI